MMFDDLMTDQHIITQFCIAKWRYYYLFDDEDCKKIYEIYITKNNKVYNKNIDDYELENNYNFFGNFLFKS